MRFWMVVFTCFLLEGCTHQPALTTSSVRYWNQHTCGFYSTEHARRRDSLEAQRLIAELNLNEKAAQTHALAKSDIELLALLDRNTDYQLHRYEKCEASVRDSQLVVTFHYDSWLTGAWHMEGWFLQLRIHPVADTFSTHIHYFVSDIGGKGKPKKPIESEIQYQQLWLNQPPHAVGDTLCGRLKVLAEYTAPGRERSTIRQIVKGNFKALIQ